MDLDLTEEQEMLRSTARYFLTKECPKTLIRELEDDEKGYSPDLWRKMSELGWMGLVLPEEYDGMDMSFMDLIILLQEMGRNVVPGPFFCSVVLGSLPILFAGTDDQKKEFLPKIANGEFIFTMTLIEPNAKYDASGVDTKAVAQGDNFIINGTKLFVENAHIADYMICVTRTKEASTGEDGITLFIVDTKSPGIKCEVMPTIADDKLCEVVLENVTVPKANMLGELDKSWVYLKKVLQVATVALCADMIGGEQQVLEMTVNYAKERIQFGQPIGSFQTVQHQCADMFIALEASRAITYEAAWKISQGLPCAMEVSMAKSWVSRSYQQATRQGTQIHGGVSYDLEHDMPLYYKWAKAAEAILGDANFHQQMIARELID